MHAHERVDVVAALVAERLLKTISLPLLLGGSEIVLTASIGIAVYPQAGADLAELLENADRALYAAKREGRDRWRIG